MNCIPCQKMKTFMFQYFIFSLCTLLTPLNVLNCTPHQVYKLSSPNRCLLLPCGILRCLPISAHAHIPPPTIPTVNLFVYFSEETETMLNPPLPARGQKGQWPWMYGTHFSNLHLGQRLACDESYPAYIDLGAASRFSLPLA